MSAVRVRVLGTLVVEGRDVSALGSRKARTLLSALASAGGEPVGVDELIDVVWADRPPGNPADQISVLVSRLRRALGTGRIERGDGGYALRADWIDVVELDERCTEAATRLAAGQCGAARAAAAAALELVRGPVAIDEAATWFDDRRRAVSRVVAQARAILARAALATDDRMGAAAAAGAALADDQYDESALQILMRADVALGRPASALAAYAAMRERLRDDLGVSPTAETEALHSAILGGTVPQRVAAAVGALVGRDDELAVLRTLLGEVAAGGTAGVVIEGEAGIGKSALTAAFLDAAGDRAVAVFGRCDEMGRELPLQPIFDGLEAHVRAVPDAAVAELLAGDTAVVGPFVGRSPGPGSPFAGVGDSDAARGLLYRGVLTVIERLAAGRPAIVVVEDTHLASTSTMTWLQMALRRGRRLLVVTTRRPGRGGALAGAARVELGPLAPDAVASWVGTPRAAALLARSGGNPLFLAELAAHDGDDVPPSIRELVATRVDRLGPAGATLRAAAVLGTAVDLDLLAAAVERPLAELLDHLDEAVALRLLVDEAAGLCFRHELVREALEASTSAARRSFLHRRAAQVLAGRPAADPLEIAWHADRGGDAQLASAAFVRAAAVASARFDLAEGRRLLDKAIDLDDHVAARLASVHNRMATWDLAAARVDAEQAIALGGGGPALEAAGWVAYYQRASGETLRFAEAGIAATADPAVRASCLALAGRTLHSLGDLDAAEAHLREAVAVTPVGAPTVAHVWLAALRVHRGDDAEALRLISRAPFDLDHSAHPFAPAHALFGRAHAHGHRGEVGAALAALDELDALVEREGDQLRRFGPISQNCRGWVLRGVGALDEARACNALAAALAPDDPPNAEPRFAGHLDLVEHELTVGDLTAAARRLDGIARIDEWFGSMHWRHKLRYRLQRGRVAMALGDVATARQIAAAVEEDCRIQQVRRYELLAVVLAGRAGGAERATLVTALSELESLAALEVWWLTAEAAGDRDDDELWRQARRRLDTLAAAAGAHQGSLRSHAAARFPLLV